MDPSREPFVSRYTGHGPKRRKARGSATPVALLIATISLLASFILLASEPYSQVVGLNTAHAPITIGSDAEFATMAAAESWPGDGSASSPYIIQNYDIDATSSSYGIHIYTTAAHFAIRNCTIYNSSLAGIHVNLVSDAEIVNNTCYDNPGRGIYLNSASNCVVNNNTCTDSLMYGGIYLGQTTGCRIENNTCDDNFVGIYVYFSSNNNHLANNTCRNQSYGILLYSSYSCTLRDNRMVNDGINVWGTIEGEWNGHDIDTSNLANSKPVYYFKNQTGPLSVPTGAGEVILASCRNVSMDGLDISNVSYAVTIAHSRNCSVTNSTFGYNKYNAVTLVQSTQCRIFNNSCRQDQNFDIYLFSSSGNEVENNTCQGGAFYAIYLLSADSNRIENNTCSGHQAGVYVDSSASEFLANNTMTGEGVVMYGTISPQWSSHSIGASNEVNGKPVAYLCGKISQGVAAGAGQIILAVSSNITVDGHNLSDASAGLQIAFSTNITVVNCTIADNALRGMYSIQSENCTISETECSRNGMEGFYIYQSERFSVHNCSFEDNTNYAIGLDMTNNCTVWNNTFLRNNGASSTYSSSNIQAADSGSLNRWNVSGIPHGYGNFWGDWATPDNLPPGGDGIVDSAYQIYGPSMSMDVFPQTAGWLVPEFGNMMIPVVSIALLVVAIRLARRDEKT